MLRSTFQLVQRRTFTNTSRLLIAEGDKIPNVKVQLKSPAETAQTTDLLKGKSILFGKGSTNLFLHKIIQGKLTQRNNRCSWCFHSWM